MSHSLIVNASDNEVHVASMGSTWVLSAPGRPHVGPMSLAIRGHPVWPTRSRDMIYRSTWRTEEAQELTCLTMRASVTIGASAGVLIDIVVTSGPVHAGLA